MNSGLSWDEFRLVKSVAEARSLVGAAESLGVNHSTVFRRLAALEQAVGARLFERSRAGYEPTAAGEEMIALASTMAESVLEFERRVAGRDIKPTGELSVTTPEAIGQHFMPAIIAQFQSQNPGIVVELILSNQSLNLSRRDADIAIRLTNDPPETLVGRRICTGRWTVYCRRDLIAELEPEAIDSVSFIGFTDSSGPPLGRRWIEANIHPRRLVAHANSTHCMLQMALQGLGATLLPCFLGDARPDLTRLGPLLPELDLGLWMLTHSDLRRSARVRAFMDFVGAELTKHRRAIEGEETGEAE
ncbi:MAG: LysR family transcriptional regulator [Hyphomicrobiales bacterium]|nr:LysR family transcriptional regulator [Hyphomicrobiales bacterium]MBV9910525.1 LysR family transcriptional regulator [Hyphomicrobiales bacterium]